MRFQRLEIPAYGPFTDLSLDLPKGTSDFHLIYGPNEAHKGRMASVVYHSFGQIRDT